MPALADTVAALVARSRAAVSLSGAALVEVAAFGDNPGALRMLSHAPAGLEAGAPLVVVLHGCGQTAECYAQGAGWLTLADRYGFAVVCAEQTRANNPNLCFNWFNPDDVSRGSGEVASIAAMVAHAAKAFGSDADRVFVTGLSAGGAMTAALLATYPELFRAGAIVAGLPYGAATNIPEALSAMRGVPPLSDKAWGDRVRGRGARPDRWPSVSVWHGDVDTTVAPAAADALVQQWTDVHGVSASEDRPTRSPRHRHRVWRNVAGEAVVQSHRIAGLGHGAPIAANGTDGCGAAGPWILEAGVSSTLEIARSWDLTVDAGAAEGEASRPPEPEPAPAPSASSAPTVPMTAMASAAPRGVDVAEVINKALKAAGLIR